MKNVWVFGTSVESPQGVLSLSRSLDRLTGQGGWNFDLDDCDRVLRVDAVCRPEDVIRLLNSAGYSCAELGDEVPGFNDGMVTDWIRGNRMAS